MHVIINAIVKIDLIYLKRLLTLLEIVCDLDSVMAPPHGQSDNMSSKRLNTTNYGELLMRQSHVF